MRNIVLKRGSVAKYDDGSPFLVEAGELELRFTLPDPNGDYFLVAGKRKVAIPKDGHVSLAVTEGTLNAAVKRYIRGKLVESYAVEPLEVMSVDGEVTAFPELSVLQRRAAELEKDIKEEVSARKNVIATQNDAFWKSFTAQKNTLERAIAEQSEEQNKALHKLAVAFLRYAYTDYQRNVYVNTRSLSLGQFLTALGFSKEDFTAEELAAINEEAKI